MQLCATVQSTLADSAAAAATLAAALAPFAPPPETPPSSPPASPVPCPCLTAYPEGAITTLVGVSPMANILNFTTGQIDAYAYPPTYGLASCDTHDATLPPFCATLDSEEGFDPPANPSWCSDSWCYVDPANCDVANDATSYFNADVLHYSYAACGTVNQFYAYYVANAPRPQPPMPPELPPPAPPAAPPALYPCPSAEEVVNTYNNATGADLLPCTDFPYELFAIFPVLGAPSTDCSSLIWISENYERLGWNDQVSIVAGAYAEWDMIGLCGPNATAWAIEETIRNFAGATLWTSPFGDAYDNASLSLLCPETCARAGVIAPECSCAPPSLPPPPAPPPTPPPSPPVSPSRLLWCLRRACRHHHHGHLRRHRHRHRSRPHNHTTTAAVVPTAVAASTLRAWNLRQNRGAAGGRMRSLPGGLLL